MSYLIYYFYDIKFFFSPFHFSWNLFSQKRKKFLCKVCSINPITSSYRDAVLFFVSGILERSLIALSSLRSVNSRCSVIVIHPTEEVLSQAFIQFCKALNIILVSYSFPKELSDLPFLSRFLSYSNWVKSHISDFDKVFHVDSFDTYFQGDIFTDDITSNTLHATLEGRIIEDEVYNTNWLNQCYGEGTSVQLGKNKIICSGTFGGPTQIFSDIVHQIINSTNFWKKECLRPSVDQAHYIYLIWNNYIRNASIPIVFHGCDSGLVTATYCNNFIHDNSTGFTYNFKESPPRMIHQYDRFSDLNKWVNTTQCGTILPIKDDVHFMRRNPGIYRKLSVVLKE